jgi:hypothetical protein
VPITTPPTFSPPAYAIKTGTAGQVLMSNGGSAAPTFQAAGGGTIPGFLAALVPAGANNDFNPGGAWPTNIGRLDVDPSLGVANLTGLVAGIDGQLVVIFNSEALGGNNLTLNNQNAASAAANRFQGSGDFIIVPQNSLTLCYYAGAINRWRLNV